jgi:hypothetical protein
MASMQVTLDTLRQLLNTASYKANGDPYEQQFGDLLLGHFPNCERFWKMFVIPLTERMAGYPIALLNNIRFRQGMNADLEDIAAIHYSMFLNLVYAHVHLQSPILSSLEDFYVHLASACDLVDTFLEKSYILLLKCRGGQTKILQALTRDEFLCMAGEWYDEKYRTVYDYYLSRGKFAQMKLPSRDDLVKEFVKDYLDQNSLWKDYAGHSKSVREFRNVIVHDVQVGKFMCNGVVFIPKPRAIQSYRTWRQVFSVKDPNVFRRDFAALDQQLKEDLDLLKSTLNQLWELVIHELELEFYQKDKTVLRHLYQLQI